MTRLKGSREDRPAAPEEAGRESIGDRPAMDSSVTRHGGLHIRAGALFRIGDYVLLHHSKADPFWAAVGGRIEFGEFSKDAVVREVREEMGVDCTVVRLVWVVENMFAYAGIDWHGIEFYYECESPGLDPSLTRDPESAESDLIARWFHRSELAGLTIYPEFLQTRLAEPWPAGIEHITCTEVPH